MIPNAIELPYVDVSDSIGTCEEDQCFGSLVHALRKEWPENTTEKKNLQPLLPEFCMEGKVLCTEIRYASHDDRNRNCRNSPINRN